LAYTSRGDGLSNPTELGDSNSNLTERDGEVHSPDVKTKTNEQRYSYKKLKRVTMNAPPVAKLSSSSTMTPGVDFAHRHAREASLPTTFAVLYTDTELPSSSKV